ncbi:RNA polymerase sigma-70 factor [uncultured Sunxiuqinia sp.]|uniref:RNA polymerase sigma-70 factor n=1 Tax=uncultured Sunxiuqinia sp. TaxID=1573825 RepID=UPI002AA761C3|nr:RNA polymerase sigma-70 factor [uncultured Sunxiuqinia sp.]
MQKIENINERTLIERFKVGDEAAFELLFRFYYAGLVLYANQIILNRADSEEIVQDFFVRLWEDRLKINITDSLKPYLFTCIKNKAFNYLKSVGIKEKVHQYIKEQVEEDILYDPDIYISEELQGEIKRAIEKLPERCREVFMKSRFKGDSNDEIANELNISKRTVETQISKALRILRVELKEYVELLVLLGILKNF